MVVEVVNFHTTYSKASRYTDFTDTRFLIGSINTRVTLISSLFFTDTRFFEFGKMKIVGFSIYISEQNSVATTI